MRLELTHFFESIKEHYARLDPKDRRALIIVTVFLTVVFGYVRVIEPLLIRSDQANAALAELQDQQRRFTRQVLMLPRREAKLAEYRSELSALKRQFELEAIEPEAAVSKNIVELTYYARLAKVSVSAIRPLDPINAGEYTDIPLEIEASANFEALRKFLYYIDTSPSLLAITDIQLNREQQGLLQARLKLSNIVLAENQANSEPSPANLMPRDNRLQIAISRWTGYAPLVVAKHMGYLESEFMQVNLLLIDDMITVERLLVSGDADGIGVSLPGLLNYWAQGIPLKIVFPFNSAAGTEGIAVLPDSTIKKISDLRQQRIGVDERGILKYVLREALKTADLDLPDVQLHELDASQVARELASGTLEVGLTREPYLTTLVDRKQARVIYTSSELEGMILDLLVITPKTIERKAQVVQFLVKGLLKARKFIADQPERALEIIAKWENQPTDVTRANLAKITLFDKKQIEDYFNEKSLSNQMSIFESYLESIGQPLPLVTIKDLISPGFFQHALNPVKTENDHKHES